MIVGGVTELKITSRKALGDLWLPWCVERRRPDRVLQIAHQQGRVGEARQLQVRDVDEGVALSALRENGGRDTTASIIELAEIFRQCARRGRVVLAPGPPLPPGDWPRVFELAEGPMLCEGSHRSCGLYSSGIESFELRALAEPLRWSVYGDPGLRAA